MSDVPLLIWVQAVALHSRPMRVRGFTFYPRVANLLRHDGDFPSALAIGIATKHSQINVTYKLMGFEPATYVAKQLQSHWATTALYY